MAIVETERVTSTGSGDRIVERSDSTGWVVAVLILIAVIAGGAYAWMHYRHAPATQGGTNINVNLPPPPPLNQDGSTGGNASGAGGGPQAQ